MPLTHLTYAYIEAGGSEPTCLARAIGPDDQSYIQAHADHLIAKARSGSSPEASFTSAEAAGRFESLARGTDEEFLAAAAAIAADIQRRMDHRTKPGLLVASRLDHGSESVTVAVLKLEVAERYAGILKEVAAGQLQLTVVRDRMTGASELQKGGVTPDPRADSDLVVGDQLNETAEYFLRGLGVRQFVKPGPAVTAAHRVMTRGADPERAQRIAVALQEDRPEELDPFIDAHPELFDEEQAADLRRRVEEGPRPIKKLDPGRAAAARRTIRAAGITISGAVGDMVRTVQSQRLDDGRWRITIDTEIEPEIVDEF